MNDTLFEKKIVSGSDCSAAVIKFFFFRSFNGQHLQAPNPGTVLRSAIVYGPERTGIDSWPQTRLYLMSQGLDVFSPEMLHITRSFSWTRTLKLLELVCSCDTRTCSRHRCLFAHFKGASSCGLGEARSPTILSAAGESTLDFVVRVSNTYSPCPITFT